jgi:hypothetical protein
MDSLDVPRKLWEHPAPESTEMYRLMQEINAKHNLELKVRQGLGFSFSLPTDIIDILGSLPIFDHKTSPILGPSFPIPRPNIQRHLYDSR